MGGQMYAVAGGKGGVGKTTTSVNLAAALQAAGQDTVVVDADLSMTNLGEVLDVTVETSIHDVLADRADLADAIADGRGGVSVLPGEGTIDAYSRAEPERLGPVLRRLGTAFDAIVVDTGAGLSHASLIPFGLADETVLVTTTDDVAVTDATKTAEMVREVDGAVAGVVVTRTDEATDVDAIADRFDAPLLGAVPDSTAAGEEPMVVTAPESDPAGAYREVAEQLVTVRAPAQTPVAGATQD